MCKLILKDSLLVPRKVYLKKKEEIKKHFSTTLIDVNECQLRQRNLCQLFRNDRESCFDCSHAIKNINLIKIKDEYIKIPRGDIGLIKNLFEGFEILDKRSFPKVNGTYKFKWDELSNKQKAKKQKEAVNSWLKKRYGVLKAPPRSGKTVMGVAIGCRLKTRVLILANQKELIHQFVTTIKKFVKSDRKNIYAVNPKIEDIPKYKFCLYTYQQFLSNEGKERLKKIKNLFGLTIIDEVHRSAAKVFSKVVSRINSKYRLGLTATPERKDGLHFKINKIVGPVLLEALSEQLPLTLHVIETQLTVASFFRWTTFINRLSINPKRNNMIIRYLREDVFNGRKVIIPVERVKHAKDLAALIRSTLGTNYVVDYCTGGTPKFLRDKIFKEAKEGKVHVLIATRKIVSTGLDLPPFDCLYEVMPSANEHNFYQEVSRIRTPYEGKKDPLVRVFVDNCSASIACFNIYKRVCKKFGFTIINDITGKRTKDDKKTSWDSMI